jgi:hypothetical protein
VRFQAERSNDCWQFDLSLSDLKHIEARSWVDPTKGEPTLMLYSVVDGGWIANFPPDGIREMCAWEQYCRFAREPERRKVGIDARASVDDIA